jgi:hypothetical protein
MTVRSIRNIPVLMMWLAMACMGVGFASAQSDSNSSTQLSSRPGYLSGPSNGEEGEAISATGRKTSQGAHNFGMTPGMASPWTAGAKSFGGGSNQSWGTNPSFDAGMAWSPRTDSFEMGAQPGGIWAVHREVSTGTGSIADHASQEMIQAAKGNPSLGLNPSTAGDLTRAINQSGAENFSPGLQSNRLAASGMTSKMQSPLLHSAKGMGIHAQGRTAFGLARGFESFRGSSMGRSSRRTNGSLGYASQSIEAGRITHGRAFGPRWSGGSVRQSLSESSDEQRRYSDSSHDTKQTRTGLGGELGERNQGFGSKGFEKNLSKRRAGNGKEPAGKSRSNHGLNADLPR